MSDKITQVEQIALIQRQLVWETYIVGLVYLCLNCESKGRRYIEQILICFVKSV